MKKKILIIDGSSLFFRAFFALPLLKTKKGLYTNAIYGFVMMLENAIDKVNPDSIAVCFDMKGKTFRHEMYDEYKGNRDKTPTELEQQFPLVREILKLMNIEVLEMHEFEADDIAGSISKKASEEGYKVYIITGDRDYYQLVDENITVLYNKKGITNMNEITPKSIREEYDLTPSQLIDLKGLMGDNSDNIPGVPGVGPKTGLKLLHEYGSMENLYEHIDEVSGKKLKEKLIDNKTQAFMSKKLGTIVRTVPIPDLKEFEMKKYNYEELSKMYRDFEFSSLLDRLPEEYRDEEVEMVHKNDLKWDNLSFDEIIKEIQEKKSFSFKFITDGKIYEGINPIYLAIKVEKMDPVFINLKDILTNEEKIVQESMFESEVVSENPEADRMISELKKIFEDEAIEKVSIAVKEDYIILQNLGIDMKNLKHDVLIAEYLLNATSSDYDIHSISYRYFNEGYMTDEELLGKGKKRKKYSDLPDEDLKKYFAFCLNTVERLRTAQIEKIMEEEMLELYLEVELPLAEVLASMELTGIRTNADILDEIGENLDIKIAAIENGVYSEAGEKFNINSPKALGIILFEKLEYPVIKKTKTGYSTAADVLEKLKDKGPIVEYVLEYRKLTKLKSTYVDGLKEIINPKTGKIHSHFNQTVTATGRISSTEPNLQNIPIRSEEGRLIRKAFLADGENSLVDADYSQIELRVLASLSEDENMVQAFKDDDDIHKRTASEVFHVPLNEVDSKLRSQAKAVNFGIVYGISDYGLSQNLNIPRKEAAMFIDEYLKHYQGIKEYMDEEVKIAREKAYVKTLLNRRRYIPELNAKNFNIRSFGERVALNTPIQGTAADIIKIAMINVYKALKERKMKSKLILQIHDELVVDADKSEVQIVEKLMKEIMEDALELRVPLKIDMMTGKSLYETK